jgi:hypothetical protein
MQNVRKSEIIERATNVAIISTGIYLFPYVLISEMPWRVVLPIIAVILIVSVVVGIPRRFLHTIVQSQLQGFMVFLSILLPLVCFLAFGLLGVMLIFGLTIGVPLPEQGGVFLVFASIITSIANLVILVLNAVSIISQHKSVDKI